MVYQHPYRIRCAFEVVPLILEGTYDSQHLLVVGLVVLFYRNKLPRLEGYGVLLGVLYANALKLR